MPKIATVIVAAGASTRMGVTKQLLAYGNHTLIEHSIFLAMNCLTNPIVVVLGANHIDIQKQIQNHPIYIVHNPQWQVGISTSIAAGVNSIIKDHDEVEGILFLLPDQVEVSHEIIAQLIAEFNTKKNDIVACSYANTYGPPIIFSKNCFEKLLALKGDEGAKKLIKSSEFKSSFIPFEQASIDIDTIEDYNKWNAQNNREQ